MEQKLELLEKEQQKLRKEGESLREIINFLQVQMTDEINNFYDSCDNISISSSSSENCYIQEIKDMNESLINKIETKIESKRGSFKDCIIQSIKDEKNK